MDRLGGRANHDPSHSIAQSSGRTWLSISSLQQPDAKEIRRTVTSIAVILIRITTTT